MRLAEGAGPAHERGGHKARLSFTMSLGKDGPAPLQR